MSDNQQYHDPSMGSLSLTQTPTHAPSATPSRTNSPGLHGLNTVIPRNQVFQQQQQHNYPPTQRDQSGFYNGNSANISSGRHRQQQQGAFPSSASNSQRQDPSPRTDDWESQDEDGTSVYNHPYTTLRPEAVRRLPSNAGSVSKGKQRSRNNSNIGRSRSATSSNRYSSGWLGVSPRQPPLRSNTNPSSAYLDPVETMDDHIRSADGMASRDPSGQAQSVSHKPSAVMSDDTALGSPSGAPSRQNTKMSLPSRKRSSMQILEAKVPRAFRADLPTAEEVLDLENGGRRRHHHFGLHSRHMTSSEDWRRKISHRLEAKNIVVAGVAEFCGTFLFLFFALAINTTVSNTKDAQKAAGGFVGTDLIALLVSSLGFGFGLVISAWVFYRVSGGVQNPAITLALTIVGALDWKRCISLSIFQYIGAIAASALISALYPGEVNSRTTLDNGTSVAQGFWLEYFMSVELIFTVLMLACEKHRATYLAPVGIGLALFNTQLLGQPYTGASVNPARSLGPDVAQAKFESYAWIYWVAPYFAAVTSSVFFLVLKWIRYETTSPDQDADEAGSGLKKQVILDAQGNIIGTIDELHHEEFSVDERNEKSESTVVAPSEVINGGGAGEDTTDYGHNGKAGFFPSHGHAQSMHPGQPEPSVGAYPGSSGGSGYGFSSANSSQAYMTRPLQTQQSIDGLHGKKLTSQQSHPLQNYPHRQQEGAAM